MKQKLVLITQPVLFTCIFVMNLIGCGDVKVVDAQSTFAKADPLNEIVAVSADHDRLDNIGCLKIKNVISETHVLFSDEDPQVFKNALRAHLAPLNYPVEKKCGNSIQLMVNEYKVHDLVVASRLIIDIHGSIQDAADNEIWSAQYRLTENAGNVPLDPISAGLGMASSVQNTSEDARHNGIYLAVRRLLRALPEHQGLDVPIMATEIPGQISKTETTNTEKPKTLADALNLWDKKNYGDALEIMEGLYRTNPRPGNGYQFGLMLEAMGDLDEAANVYADTAVAQAEIRQPVAALRTLRRLQRLNEANKERHNPQLNRAVQAISEVLKN